VSRPTADRQASVNFVYDLTLGLGKVVHDYLHAPALRRKSAASLAPAATRAS
jgi:hypothetical protein